MKRPVTWRMLLLQVVVLAPSANLLGRSGRGGQCDRAAFDPRCNDLHVHFREPGYTHKKIGRLARNTAAMNGVTTVFEMQYPSANPFGHWVRQKQELLLALIWIYGLLAEDNIDIQI